jgi:hypothetical protein
VKCWIVGIILCLGMSGSALAQDAVPKERPAITTGKASKVGPEKPSKSKFSDDGWGLKFTVPSGWVAQKGADGIVVSSPKNSGFILVFPHQATSTDELTEGASEGMIIDGKNYLRVIGEPRSFSKTGVSAKFGGIFDGKNKVSGYAVGVLSKFGDGAVVLAVVQESEFDDKDQKTVDTIAKSIRFYKPRVPATVKDWKKELGGSKLEYLAFYRSSGFGGDSGSTSKNNTIILCPDGSFLFRDRGHAPISTYNGGGIAPHEDDILGLWDVESTDEKTSLTLNFDGGKTGTYIVDYNSKVMKLNSHRYYWSPIKCR